MSRKRDLLPIRGIAGQIPSSVFEENFRRVRDVVRGDGGRNLSSLAALLGGQAFEQTLTAGVDNKVRHNLGVVPKMVVMSAALDTDAGSGGVVGSPSGPGGAANSTAWTDEFVYVRVSKTGTYAFVIL